jgi:hypothetical protein
MSGEFSFTSSKKGYTLNLTTLRYKPAESKHESFNKLRVSEL